MNLDHRFWSVTFSTNLGDYIRPVPCLPKPAQECSASHPNKQANQLPSSWQTTLSYFVGLANIVPNYSAVEA
ncbi:hypothetical protein J6590_038443 [Homalodisca vitripennis]|nr:hypothetical protein J6590_038443 [Homalodisca vitripennis]